MKNRFYLACFRDNVGSNVSFQRHEFNGYHTDIDQAHECTLEEAQWEFDHAREYDLPISADHVDELSVWKVDCQYIPKETQPFTDIHNTYVAFQKGIWDGNDVYWLISENQNTSTDFDQAYVMGVEKAKKLSSRFVVIPYDSASKAKRRTFDFKKLDKRTMVQGAGLKMPEHLKKENRKKEDPMTRFNCPECGKINWQHNPYDFEGCSHCCHGSGVYA